MRRLKSYQFEHNKPKKIGILLVQLGSINKLNTQNYKKFLSEFLGDDRVVELPKLLWTPIKFLIKHLRAKKLIKNYKKIWLKQGSPLIYYTENICKKLQQKFNDNNCVLVDYAMRYGEPSIQSKLDYFKKAQVDKLIILSLNPQYASSSTGTNMQAVMEYMCNERFIPELFFINNYAHYSDFIKSTAIHIKNSVDLSKIDTFVFSYHGIPKITHLKGDPYHCQCLKTSRLIAEELGINNFKVCFQSIFGKQEWLQPYAIDILESLAKQNQNIAIYCPGFSVDCLETLEEINISYRELFEKKGGGDFQYIPTLNDSDEQIDSLHSLLRNYLEVWLNSKIKDNQNESITNKEYLKYTQNTQL